MQLLQQIEDMHEISISDICNIILLRDLTPIQAGINNALHILCNTDDAFALNEIAQLASQSFDFEIPNLYKQKVLNSLQILKHQILNKYENNCRTPHYPVQHRRKNNGAQIFKYWSKIFKYWNTDFQTLEHKYSNIGTQI